MQTNRVRIDEVLQFAEIVGECRRLIAGRPRMPLERRALLLRLLGRACGWFQIGEAYAATALALTVLREVSIVDSSGEVCFASVTVLTATV